MKLIPLLLARDKKVAWVNPDAIVAVIPAADEDAEGSIVFLRDCESLNRIATLNLPHCIAQQVEEA
jgi:hypothetical protein